MKLKEGFIPHMVEDEMMIVGTGSSGFNGVVRTNKTGAFIVEKLKEETTRQQILDAMIEHYEGAPVELMEKDLDKMLAQLSEIGALDG